MSDLEDRIGSLFAPWARADSPGAAVAVAREGEIVFKGGFGMASLDHGVAIGPSTVFHSASVSKQFTAMAVYLLAQDGLLSLDDEIHRHVAGLRDFGAPITLDHLIHHTSGLRDQWELLHLSGWRYSRDLITDEDVLEVVSRQSDLNFAPGTRFMYCNTGYTLLARAVAKVSGQTFRQFTTSRIFAPLGMARTFFRDRYAEIVRDAASGYQPHGDGFELSQTNLETVGATSMLTTVEDLCRWDANFRSGRVGGAPVFERMHRRGVLDDGSRIAYGGGVGIGAYCGLDIIEHTGGDAGFRSNLLRFPRHGLAVAILGNLSTIDAPALSRRIADICLRPELDAARAAASPAPQRRSDPAALERLAGCYVDPEDGDRIFHLHFYDGRLFGGAALREQSAELSEVGDGVFRFALYPRTEIAPGGNGTLSLNVDGRTVNRFRRAVPHSHCADGIEELAGIYDCARTGCLMKVELCDGGLACAPPRQPMEPMTAVEKDLFSRGGFRMRFTRDAGGAVVCLVLNTDRLRNVRLARRRDAEASPTRLPPA